MAALGITGGVATGKSTFTRMLAERLGAEVFDSDKCAHDLLSHDPAVAAEIRARFGGSVFDEHGKVCREALRDVVFKDSECRKSLEEILHPRIRDRWTGLLRQYEGKSAWLLVDIPLMFETMANSHFERIIVVAASEAVQRQRLEQERKLDHAMAGQIIAAQMPMAEKIERATCVIWNDVSLASLEAQTGVLAEAIEMTL